MTPILTSRPCNDLAGLEAVCEGRGFYLAGIFWIGDEGVFELGDVAFRDGRAADAVGGGPAIFRQEVGSKQSI